MVVREQIVKPGALVSGIKLIVLASALASTLTGCQSTGPIQSPGLDNSGFMNLWGTYKHCLSSTDAYTASSDANTLEQAGAGAQSRHDVEATAHSQFENLMPQPSPRLAVDVRAMAAACTLHAGHLAIASGKHELAHALLTSIVRNHTLPQFSYYHSRAQEELVNVKLNLQAAL